MEYKLLLPIFPGFNNTLFSPNILPELNDINQRRLASGQPQIKPDMLVFDYDQYKLRVAKAACDYIGSQLSNWKLIESLKFESISEEGINISIQVSSKNTTNMIEFGKKHNFPQHVTYDLILRTIGIDEHLLYYNIDTSISAENYSEFA